MNSLYDFHDEYYMRLALDEARAAADEGEIPSAPLWWTPQAT